MHAHQQVQQSWNALAAAGTRLEKQASSDSTTSAHSTLQQCWTQLQRLDSALYDGSASSAAQTQTRMDIHSLALDIADFKAGLKA